LESEYINAGPPKPMPPPPVRVSRRSQLTAALKQHARPIIIEDQELARPFARLSRARQLRLWGPGGLVTDALSCVLTRCYGADIEAHWHIGRYILPGNAEKVILKPKGYGKGDRVTPMWCSPPPADNSPVRELPFACAVVSGEGRCFHPCPVHSVRALFVV